MDYAGGGSSASPTQFLMAAGEDGWWGRCQQMVVGGEVRGLATIILDTLDTLDIYTWPSVKGDGRHQAISQDLWAV